MSDWTWLHEFPGWYAAESLALRELQHAYADLYAQCERLLDATARDPRLRPIQRYVSSRCRAARSRPLQPQELCDLKTALNQLEHEQISQLSNAFARVWIETRKRRRG